MDDFTFYSQFTKPMVLNLPNIKDRVMAALWLEKLSEINEINPKDDLHVEYLKLLLLALQRNNLVGIFKEHPPEGSLLQYPEMNTTMDMIKLVKPLKSKPSSPSIYTAIGSGMREFTAVQEIPNFGLHGYYAISNEPLPLWTHNKSGLLKNSRDTKNISRFKDSHEYKRLKESDSFQITSQKVEIATRVTSDTQQTNTANETNLKEDQIEEEEISGIETRPCWGTSRYFERLIDQSPYVTADLETATTDALLHLFKDKKVRLDKETNDSCVLSMRRKQLEKFDSKCSPCAYDSEYKRIQSQGCSEHLQNPEDVEFPSTNSCMKDNTYISMNKSQNKWKNNGAQKSSIFSKSCFLNSGYCARL